MQIKRLFVCDCGEVRESLRDEEMACPSCGRQMAPGLWEGPDGNRSLLNIPPDCKTSWLYLQYPEPVSEEEPTIEDDPEPVYAESDTLDLFDMGQI